MFIVDDRKLYEISYHGLRIEHPVILPHGADRDPEFVKALYRADEIDDALKIIDNWRNV